MGVWLAAYVYLFVCSGLVCLALTRLAISVAPGLGALDRPGGRKAHDRPTPHLGGLAMYTAFVLVVLVHLVAAWAVVRSGVLADRLPPAFVDALGGVRLAGPRLFALLVGGGAAALLGLADDMRGLAAPAKFAGQVAAAAFVAAVGVRATFFVAHPIFGGVMTVLWIVGVTNAFNFLDHMDGLASGVALIAGAIFFVSAVMHGQLFVSAMLAVFCGCALGFLVWNRHPAKIFMGDCGSHFIGFTLACLTVLSTFYTYGRATPLAAAMPLLILGVPIFDAAVVVVRRIRAGRPFWVGDRSHLSHRLVDLGMTVKGAVLTVYLLTFAVGLPALLLGSLNWRGASIVLIQAAAVFALILRLEAAGGCRS